MVSSSIGFVVLTLLALLFFSLVASSSSFVDAKKRKPKPPPLPELFAPGDTCLGQDGKCVSGNCNTRCCHLQDLCDDPNEECDSNGFCASTRGEGSVCNDNPGFNCAYGLECKSGLCTVRTESCANDAFCISTLSRPAFCNAGLCSVTPGVGAAGSLCTANKDCASLKCAGGKKKYCCNADATSDARCNACAATTGACLSCEKGFTPYKLDTFIVCRRFRLVNEYCDADNQCALGACEPETQPGDPSVCKDCCSMHKTAVDCAASTTCSGRTCTFKKGKCVLLVA